MFASQNRNAGKDSGAWTSVETLILCLRPHWLRDSRGCRPLGWLSWSTTCGNLDCAKVYPQKVHFSTPTRGQRHFDFPSCAEANSLGQINSQRKQFCPEEKRSNALCPPGILPVRVRTHFHLIYCYPPQMEQFPPELTPEQKTLWLLTSLLSKWLGLGTSRSCGGRSSVG